MSSRFRIGKLCARRRRDARAAHAAVVGNKGQLTIAESVEQEAAAREEHTKVLERMEAVLNEGIA